MTTCEVLKLIKKGENRKCDFKREFYHFPEKKHDFIKDVSAMANTTLKGEDDSLIIIGYKEDGTFHNVDLSLLPDESTLQELMTANVAPKVNFHLEPIKIKIIEIEYQLLLIRIPVSARKPHIINKNFPNTTSKLFEGQCFIRDGSSTAKANRHQIAEMVYDADGNSNRTKKLIKYITSMSKIGGVIDENEIYKLLDYDLIPMCSIDFTNSLNMISTNSNGESINQFFVSETDKNKDESLFQEIIEHVNNKDYTLAETFLQKISNIKAYYEVSMAAGVIYGKINEDKKALEYFKRAKELNPNEPEIYLRYSMYFLQNKDKGNALLYLEKGYDLITDDSRLELHIGMVHNLYWIYKEIGVSKKATNYLTEYLELKNSLNY